MTRNVKNKFFFCCFLIQAMISAGSAADSLAPKSQYSSEDVRELIKTYNDDTLSLVKRLAEDRQIVLATDQNTKFLFRYIWNSSGDYSIEVSDTRQPREIAGYIDFQLGVMGRSSETHFKTTGRREALWVSGEFSSRYRGLGRTLIALTLGLHLLNHQKVFYAQEVISTRARMFYTALGFTPQKLVSSDNETLIFDLASTPIPPAGIFHLKTGEGKTVSNLQKLQLESIARSA